MLGGLFTILPFTACLFWMAVLSLDWRRDNAAQHVLAAFMGVSAVLYLCHAVFFNHYAPLRGVSECIYAFCTLSVFPLYYLYICRLTDPRGLSWRHLSVLLPAIAIALWATALHVLCPDDADAERVREAVMRTVFVVQLVPVCVLGYRRLSAFDREIANAYADTEARSVRPTRRMMVLLIGGALVSGVANLIGREYFDSAQLYLPSILFTMLLFGVGYVGNRQEFCIDDLMRDDPAAGDVDGTEAEQTQEPGANEAAELSHIISRLNKVMAERQLYLRPDLRLSEVASLIGVGRTTLSQHINQHVHLSFSDYVNRLRIDHACRLLAEPGHSKMSLTMIAEMCGFASDSSFYRAFRRHVGMTPKQYVESR